MAEGPDLSQVRVGLVGEARTVVDDRNVAAALGARGRRVFSTPHLVALIEQAAYNAVDRLLPEGWVTVGSMVKVNHLAATPVGFQVRARAELIEVDRRRLKFRVEAWDQVEKVGEGTHERFIVDLERFMWRTATKGAARGSGSE